MKTFITAVALLVAGLFVSTPSAYAGEVSIGIGVGIRIGEPHGRPHGHYGRPPVVIVPAPSYRPCPQPVCEPPPVIVVQPAPPVVIVERPCHDPFVTTVYEERWIETVTVVGYDRYYDRCTRRWVTVERP